MRNLPNAGRLALCGLVAWTAAGACSKSDDAGKPAGLPPSSSAPLNPPPAAAPPPPPAPMAEPAPAAAPPAAADPNATITGQIVLAPALRAHVAASDVIFLVARKISDNPTARGSLVAVKKLSATKLPLAFTLTAADMPFQNGPFEGDLALSARVDKDGDPMSRTKGDVFGTLPKVRVGARGVKLAIDQLQKEDESLAQPGAPGHGGPMGGLPAGHP